MTRQSAPPKDLSATAAMNGTRVTRPRAASRPLAFPPDWLSLVIVNPSPSRPSAIPQVSHLYPSLAACRGSSASYRLPFSYCIYPSEHKTASFSGR